MKTIIRLFASIALLLGNAIAVHAQVSPRTYYHAGWQFNRPFSTHFADKPSGWGLHFEAGYYFTPRWSVGAFVNYHTNNEYVPRTTFITGNTAYTTDQQHSLFQVPLGVSLRYRLFTHRWQPYLGIKTGAKYSNLTSLYNTSLEHSQDWGFYVSPEAGISVFPFKVPYPGFTLSVYYSYATNRGSVLHYNLDRMNNIGLRLGVTF